MNARSVENAAVRKAIVGIVLVAVIMAVVTNLSRISSLVGSQTYTAALTDGGGIRSGDDVRVDGINVGQVTGVELDGEAVELEFRAGDVELGDRTRLFVRSDNALGRKYVDLEPAGDGDVTSIPVDRTDPGYAAPQVLGDLTRTSQSIDTHRVADAFNSLSSVLEGSPQEFADALTGVERLSKTISSRDAELARLLQRARSVSEVLAKRNDEITGLFSDGSLIFQELLVRRFQVSSLLRNITAATQQIEAFVADNKDVLPDSLTQLRQVADLVANYRDDLSAALVDFSGYIRGLADAIASGPFFQALVPNLTTPEDLVLGALKGQHQEGAKP